MHNRSTDEHIAEARGFKSVTEMRGYFERNGYPGQKRVGEADLHARDLRIAQDLQAQMSAEAPSARSDALSAELATAKTKGERRDAVNRFMASQRTPQEARYVSWLRAREHSYAFEDRAAGEGTGSAGGDLIPPGFNASIIHYMRDYDSLFGAFEVWQSDDFGGPVVRPAYSQFSGAATDTEGTAFTEGPAPLIANQQFGDAPTYAASYRASFQLVDDAGIDLDQWVASALGESLGRALAMPASAAMYSAITAQGAVADSGGYLTLGTATPVTFTGGATTELAANTISLDTAAQLTEQIDEAYLPDAAFYLTRVQWGGLTRQVDAQKHIQINPAAKTRSLFGYPVNLTASTSVAAASTVSGPVFGCPAGAMTLRIVKGSMFLLRSNEKYAEFLEMYYRTALRADVQARDSRALVGVKYAAS